MNPLLTSHSRSAGTWSTSTSQVAKGYLRRVGGSWGAHPCESDLSIYLSAHKRFPIWGERAGSCRRDSRSNSDAVFLQTPSHREPALYASMYVCMYVCTHTYVFYACFLCMHVCMYVHIPRGSIVAPTPVLLAQLHTAPARAPVPKGAHEQDCVCRRAAHMCAGDRKERGGCVYSS